MVVDRRYKGRGAWLMPVSLAVAVVLDALPLPQTLAIWRPPWVTLFVIYWCLFEPRRAGPFTGWIMGVIVDVLQFTLLGTNALAKTVVAYLVWVFTQRVQMYSGSVQIMCVALLLSIDSILVAWIHGFVTSLQIDWRGFLPVITGTLVWPFLVAAMHNLRPLSPALRRA